MTKIEKLKAEIQNDPLAIGYSTMTDSEITNSLNAKTRTRRKDLLSSDIKSYLVLNDLWLPIKNSTAPEAILTMDSLNIFTTFRITDPVIGPLVESKLTQILDGLVSAGLITNQNKTDVLNMTYEYISRAEELGLEEVTESEVAYARSL